MDDYNEINSSNQTNQGGRSSRRKIATDDEQSTKTSNEDFRIRLFKVYYWIARERNLSQSVAVTLIVIMFSQVFDLIISPTMKLPFRGSLYEEVSNLFDAIRIYPSVIRFGGPNTYWFFMFSLLALSVIYLILLSLVDGSIKGKKGKQGGVKLLSTLKCLQIMSSGFFWVLFVPAIDFFISIFECNKSTGMHKVVTTLQCWSVEHDFYCALFTIGLVTFITCSILIALLYNESRPTHTDALTRLDSNNELFLIFYRIILVVVSHFTADQDTLQWLILAIHAFISVHLLKSYQQNITYYTKEVSITYGACCISYLWIVANAVLVKALGSIQYNGQIIVILIGFLLMWHSAKYIREGRVREVMIIKHQDKIKDDLELDIFVTNFHTFMVDQEHDQESQMMFLGFLFMHREECQQPTCPLKNNQQLYQPLGDQTSKRDAFPAKDKIMHHHFLNSIFSDFQRGRPNSLSAQHHTSFAQFLFYQIGNVHMALIELNIASKASFQGSGGTGQKSTTFQQIFTIYKYKQLIEEYLQKKFKQSKHQSVQTANFNKTTEVDPLMADQQLLAQESQQFHAYASLDVTIVITFENMFNRFEKVIEQSATDHIEFWSHLDSNMIDLNVINKLGLNIINRTKRVNDLWQQLIKINPSYPNALYLYGNFLQQIKNDYEQGEDFKQQYLQVKRLKSLEDYENQYDVMFAEDTAVVIMNGSREQQGKIMKTNQGILKLFGYSMFEVQGHDVNILMPPLIAAKHQSFLENYFKTGKERILNSCIESFAMYRTGTIFPVHLVIKPVPSLRNDIQYIGMIKSAGRDYEYIITDETGRIDAISEGVISLLKLPVSFFKEHEIPIQLIIPELCEVIHVRKSHHHSHGIERATYFDVWTGEKDLKFKIPKNFSNAGGRSGQQFGTTAQKNQKASEAALNDVVSGFDLSPDQLGGLPNITKQNRMMSTQQPAFIGLRSSESLKTLCNMFKIQQHKGQPEEYKRNLLNNCSYENPDFEKVLKTDIQTRVYGGGEVNFKMFKIFFNRKKKKGNDNGGGREGGIVRNNFTNESDSPSMDANSPDKKPTQENTLLKQQGFSALQALNDDDVFQRYLKTIAKAMLNNDQANRVDLEKDIKQLKNCFERLKRTRQNGIITTHEDYEKMELDRMLDNLKEIERTIHQKSKFNPIAAAFAHKLAIFVRSQQPGGTADKEMLSSGEYLRKRDMGEELKIGASSPLQSINLGIRNQGSPEQRSGSSRRNSKVTPNDGGATTNNALRRIEKGKREFMVDFFGKTGLMNNNFSATASPYLAQNDLVKNLQSKFKASQRDPDAQLKDASKAGEGGLTATADPNSALDKDLLGIDPDSKSVKITADDGGSVTSDSKTIISQLRILRNALYENYSPQSIQNLKYSAQFVIVVLIAMTIASFLFSQQIYGQLRENFDNVQHSQIRMQSVTGINTATRFCLLMNDKRVDRQRYSQTDDFLIKMRSDLNTKAMQLQAAQNNLSNTNNDFAEQNKYVINPNNVTLYYNTYEDVGQNQTMNIWSASMQLAINAYKIKDMPLSNYNSNHMSVQFILRNSMNNILQAVSHSTTALLDDSSIISTNNKNILLIILLVASGGMLISMLIILPVVTKVHKDKDKLLSLFLQIDTEDVKEQLKRCREFFINFHNDEKSGGAGMNQNYDGGFVNEDGEKDPDQEGEEGDDADGDEKQSKERHNNDKKSVTKGGVGSTGGPTPNGDQKDKDHSSQNKAKFTRKNKKLKKYSTNYLMLIMKFFLVISFLESYFLYQYFMSDNFLVRSLSMIKEAASITNRNFNNFLLYQIMVEIIATNGTATVFNKRQTDYIGDYIDNFNLELEKFLQVHSENVGKHDSEFNSFFENLVYKSVCSTIDGQFRTEEERSECPNYLGGVLEKGLYSANLAYWDDMREIRDAFFKSNRSESYLRSLLNSQRLISVERLNELYFAKAYQALLDRQNESIGKQFENRFKEIVAAFSVYLALLVLAYLILWGRFVESMRHSLWVTKSMLAIIPIEVIEKVKVIKDFLLTTSQAAVRSMKE